MRRLAFILSFLFPLVTWAAYLNIDTNGNVKSPTNFPKFLLLSGSNFVAQPTNTPDGWAIRGHVTPGNPVTVASNGNILGAVTNLNLVGNDKITNASGNISVDVTPGVGGGDAGGTNARQWGSATLTNLSGTGALTNVFSASTNPSLGQMATFKATVGSAVLKTLSSSGSGSITDQGTNIDFAFTAGDPGGTNARQWGTALLTNLSSNPYTGYTNKTMQVAANNVLSNLQAMVSFYWTNSQASAMLLSNLVNNPYVGYTNLTFQVAVNNVLSNIQAMASFYWTNAQASSMALSNIADISPTDGDFIVRTNSTWSKLPKGTANQVVKMDATGTYPAWGTDDVGGGGGGLTTNANQFLGAPLSIKTTAQVTNVTAWSDGAIIPALIVTNAYVTSNDTHDIMSVYNANRYGFRVAASNGVAYFRGGAASGGGNTNGIVYFDNAGTLAQTFTYWRLNGVDSFAMRTDSAGNGVFSPMGSGGAIYFNNDGGAGIVYFMKATVGTVLTLNSNGVLMGSTIGGNYRGAISNFWWGQFRSNLFVSQTNMTAYLVVSNTAYLTNGAVVGGAGITFAGSVVQTNATTNTTVAAGSGMTVTTNITGTNVIYTVNSAAGGGLTTNENQFLGAPLSIKDGVLLTNPVVRGVNGITFPSGHVQTNAVTNATVAAGANLSISTNITGTNVIYTIDSSCAGDKPTNMLHAANQTLYLNEDRTASITNSVAANVSVLLTNCVDRKSFVLRAVADGSARTVSFYTGGGTMNWISTNYTTGPGFTNFSIPANKIATAVGRVWLSGAVTNIDLFVNVQP